MTTSMEDAIQRRETSASFRLSIEVVDDDGVRIVDPFSLGEMAPCSAVATYRITDGVNSVDIPDVRGPTSAIDFIGCIARARAFSGVDGREQTLGFLYTNGLCHVFAAVYAETYGDGTCIATFEETGDLDCPALLIHAGACVGPDIVVDIEGFHDRDVWLERWLMAYARDDTDYAECGRAHLEELQERSIRTFEEDDVAPIVHLMQDLHRAAAMDANACSKPTARCP